MQTLSRLTMFLRIVPTTMAAFSGVPSDETRHSKVSTEKDVMAIVQHLNESQLVYYNQGRTQVSHLHNARRVKESSDAWSIGQLHHWTGIPLGSVVWKRVDLQEASRVYGPSISLGHEVIEAEDAYDAGSPSGSELDSRELFEGGESTSDGECKSVYEASDDTEGDG